MATQPTPQSDGPVTVGFLYPGHAAEDDYPTAEAMLGGGVRLAVRHTYGEDLHAVAELLDLGSSDKLAEGCRALVAEHHPRAVLWACTSGSFVFGWDGAVEQVAGVSAAAGGLPASSTSFAFVRAARAIGARTVAVAASYPADVADYFVRFMADAGLAVTGMAASNIRTAAEVGDLPDDDVVALATAHDHPDADAVLVPDTAMRTFALVDRIEEKLGKPVLTANQVTIWEGLRLAGGLREFDGPGTLFRSGDATAVGSDGP